MIIDPFLGERMYVDITFLFWPIASVIGPVEGINSGTTEGGNTCCKTNKTIVTLDERKVYESIYSMKDKYVPGFFSTIHVVQCMHD